MIIILLALVIGISFSYFFFFQDKKEEKETISVFQVGVFTDYSNAKKCAERNHGIVVNDNEMYRVYVSLGSDPEIILKLSDYYKKEDIRFYIKKVLVDKEIKDAILNEEMKYGEMDSYAEISYQLLLKYQKEL